MSFTYRGLKAQKDRHIITEDEINRNLERLRQQNPRIASVTDRPTENGDEIVLDYAGFCDGEQFAGGTAEKQTLVLGSGAFIPGFEEQLLDKVCGEKVTVKVTFPKAYHAENLAGKEAEFRCTIHEIRVKTEYELDDTFAQEFGHCENLEQMRQKLGESLQAFADERGEMDLQDRLLRQAAETLEFEPSQAQIDAEVENQMQNLTAQLTQQGLQMEMYCSFMGTTEDKLREDFRNNAKIAVQLQAAVELIADLENLTATKEEIEEAKAVVARQNRMTLEQLQPYCDAEFEQALTRSILTSKVMRLIRDAADVAVV